MEVGERMTVKIILTAIVLVGCNIVAAGASGDADIQGGALLSWPKDYKGVAVIPSKVRHIGNKRVKTLLYMFYCICLEECDWISRQIARHLVRQNARRLNRLKSWATPVEKLKS